MISVAVGLSEPPAVAGLGVGLHGIARSFDRYNLRDLWSLHLYSYEARLVIDDVTFRITPGTLTLAPPAAVMEYRYLGPSEHLYAHLSAPGGYWSPSDGTTSGGQPHAPTDGGPDDRTRIPVFHDLGPELAGIRDLMVSAIGHSASTPARTRADLWTVLLRLGEFGRERRDGDIGRRYVAAAMSFIENNLGEAITVPEVADVVGISHNHLTRLFHAQTGATVVAHLRARRVARAVHLLRESTMSISGIAASVGISDLQAFNKTCRAATGLSPRQLRAQAWPGVLTGRADRKG